LEEKV
jgi:hypothetical protein